MKSSWHVWPARAAQPSVLLLLAMLAVAQAAAAGGAVRTTADGPAASAAGAAPAAHDSRPPDVAWYGGSITDAFAAARSANKPVFLYWSAVWCPPCQELKATVFRRRDFLDRLSLFVPVYLDGDSAGAQAWGDTFHVTGYPTVLVLRSDHSEIERVSGGMDLARYAEVLDLALGEVRPAQELLAALDQGTAPLGDADCRRLAYNGWRLDDAWILHPETLAALARELDRAQQRCAPGLRLERTRLLLTALQAMTSGQAKDLDAGKPADAALRDLMARAAPLLADRKLALAAGDLLMEMPSQYFTAVVRADPAQRDALRARWFALMDALAVDARYSAADHIYALAAKLEAAKALDPAGKVAPALAQSATTRIDAALAREKEPYARASLVNAALNALDALEDDDRAYAILSGEVQTAANPYYYMSDLAELEEKRGNRDAAIELLARSYHTAKGPATRFQWGVGYVRGLVRMEPQDERAIREAGVAVLDELDASGDLHGRTRRSLAKLDASLRAWNRGAQHAAVIDALRERMRAICGKLRADDPAQPTCASFLAPA